MQLLCTVYIVALNVILAGFSNATVTVLGLYYKVQTFFFIPLMGLETCIVPVISYNFARGSYERCRKIMQEACLVTLVFMLAGMACFWFLPEQIIGLFSGSSEVLAIGKRAFPIIGCSFPPAVLSLLTPVFFQAIGDGKASLVLSLARQIFCLIPLFWLFSKIGLGYTWLAYPLSETITGALGLWLYFRRFLLFAKAHGRIVET